MTSRLLILTVFVAPIVACGASEPLQSEVEPGSEIVIGFAFDRGVQKSTGFHVCTTGGRVALVSVEPLQVEGEVQFLGAYVLAGAETPIGSADGFPPETSSEFLVSVDEASVIDCEREDLMDFTQVVVGADWSGDGGGVLHGFRVLYDYNGSRRSLEIPNFHIALCGVDGQHCDP